MERLSKGFSVVEVVLGAAIFGIVVTAFASTLLQGQEGSRVAGERTRAAHLADECLEAARNLRDNDFSNLSAGTHGLAVSGGQWTLSGSSDTVNNFTRALTISSIDSDRWELSCDVSWEATPQRSTSVVATTYLTNWTASSGGGGPTPTPTPGPTCAGHCTGLGYNTGTCRQNANRCTNNGETHESGGDQYCTGGPSADTCCCAP